MINSDMNLNNTCVIVDVKGRRGRRKGEDGREGRGKGVEGRGLGNGRREVKEGRMEGHGESLSFALGRKRKVVACGGSNSCSAYLFNTRLSCRR